LRHCFGAIERTWLCLLLVPRGYFDYSRNVAWVTEINNNALWDFRRLYRTLKPAGLIVEQLRSAEP